MVDTQLSQGESSHTWFELPAGAKGRSTRVFLSDFPAVAKKGKMGQ